MNALIRKELRLIIWPWIGALILAVVPGWLCANHLLQTRAGDIASANDAIIQLPLYAFALGCVVLSLTTFGQEFSHRTFTFTLAQPIDRKRIWRTKTTILAIAMLVVAIAVIVSIHYLIATYWQALPGYDPYRYFSAMHDQFNDRARVFPASVIATLLIAVAAYSGALWTTLLFRNFFTALSLTVLLPSVLLFCFSRWIFGVPSNYATTDATIVFGSYSLAGFIFARWLFLRAQDVAWTGENISLSSGNTKRFALFTSFQRTEPLFALFRKELQMQQVAFVVAAILLVCHLASFPVRALLSDQTGKNLSSVALTALNFVCVVWMALPLLIGGAAVAEERRLGTFETFLTQPVSRRTQIFVKFIVVLLLSIVFGALIPYSLERGAQALGVTTTLMPHNIFEVLIIPVFLATIAFFSSCIARSSLDAFCISIFAIWPIIGAFVMFVDSYGRLSPYIFAVCVLPIFVWLAWKNFQRIQVRWTIIAGTWLVLALSMLTAWGAGSFVWYRGWESFMSLEPRHGKPIMHLEDHVKVVSVAHGMAALLPDGRIWTAEYKYDVRREPHGEDHVRGVSLQNAQFLPGTWLDVAAGEGPYAIKSDGTLWRLRPPPPEKNSNRHANWALGALQQVGSDTDWASLSGGSRFTLALKRDGSLWGWGVNRYGVLGHGEIDDIRPPEKLWPGTRWQKVFASDPYCFGIQADGTAWQWGGVFQPAFQQADIPDYKLQPSPFVGTNWTSFSSSLPIHFATRDDNTLWSAVPERSLGHFGINWSIFREPVDTTRGLHQVGQGHDWQSLTAIYPICALKTDGSWWIHNGEHVGRPRREGVKVSRYSDWVAIDSKDATIVGLAADGTVSAWMPLDNYPYFTSPSRGPTWSTNIFATR